MVTFAAGNTPDNCFGAWYLWRRWAKEENGVDIDSAAFVDHWMGLASRGSFVQAIGWDGIEPVAMTSGFLLTHPITGELSMYGDNTYIRPDYRKAGLMHDLLEFAVQTSRFIGVDDMLAPVTAGDRATAAFLEKVYADKGFELSGLTMTRRT